MLREKCLLKAIGWTLVLLFLVMYITAVMLLQLVLVDVQDERSRGDDVRGY